VGEWCMRGGMLTVEERSVGGEIAVDS